MSDYIEGKLEQEIEIIKKLKNEKVINLKKLKAELGIQSDTYLFDIVNNLKNKKMIIKATSDFICEPEFFNSNLEKVVEDCFLKKGTYYDYTLLNKLNLINQISPKKIIATFETHRSVHSSILERYTIIKVQRNVNYKQFKIIMLIDSLKKHKIYDSIKRSKKYNAIMKEFMSSNGLKLEDLTIIEEQLLEGNFNKYVSFNNIKSYNYTVTRLCNDQE